MISKLKQLYKCPECNANMTEGYVTSNHSIRWTEEEKKGSIFNVAAESLTPNSVFKLTNPKCNGLRCKKCGIVIFREWEK